MGLINTYEVLVSGYVEVEASSVAEARSEAKEALEEFEGDFPWPVYLKAGQCFPTSDCH